MKIILGKPEYDEIMRRLDVLGERIELLSEIGDIRVDDEMKALAKIAEILQSRYSAAKTLKDLKKPRQEKTA